MSDQEFSKQARRIMTKWAQLWRFARAQDNRELQVVALRRAVEWNRKSIFGPQGNANLHAE